MASSILTDREASVNSGNGGTRPRASSNYSLFNHQPEPTNVNIHQLRPRAKSSSNLGGHLEPKFEFDDHTLIDEDGNYRRRNGLAELIDFLKNHPPPADNFMSMPDARKDDAKGTWAKFRKLAKRSSKSLSKSPDPIRLPDSAVSGITTGGHRHISISIPLDASPFGRTPRSQYPVYATRNAKGPASRYGPTRAVLNDKGVVTVLRTVTEDQESESPVAKRPALQNRSSAPASTRSRSHSRSSVGKSHSRAGSTHSNGRGKVSEYFGVSSSPPRAQPTDQFKRANDASRELQSQGQGQSQSSPTASHDARQDSSLPVRGSSLVASRFVFPPTTSIDAMMNETTTAPENLQEQPQPQNSPKETYQVPRTISTSAETAPVQPETKQAKEPLSLEEAPVLSSSKKTTEETDVTVITKSPIARGDGHISPTPSIASSQSQTRRQKVRDKKRRDIEALRNSQRQSQQSEPDSVYGGQSKEDEIDPEEEGPKSPGRKGKPPPLPLRSPSRQSLCPIMVVSDVQPSPPQSEAAQSPTDEPVPAELSAEESHAYQSPVKESQFPQSPTDQVQDQVAQLGMTQVVMTTPEVEPPLASPPLHHGFPKPPKVKPQFRPKPMPRVPSQSSVSKPVMTSPVVSFNSPNNPTPPASVKGSPAENLPGDRTSKQSSVDRSSKQSTVSADRSSKQSSIDGVDRTSKQSSVDLPTSKRGSIDQTSLSRRREWNAIREQDRKNRESRLGSRSLPKPLVLPKEDAEDAKSPLSSERDVIRRYDVYREYRFREMERRVRRLERNGDIWLRALVPVLENLNRTLSGSSGHGEQRERAQGWVSDEDFVGSLSPPRGRSSFGGFGSRRSRMMPRPGASEREFLEHLVRTKEELEAGNISDDMSGFDTIEPLMRELAGRSRLSFEARSMALAEDDEALFRGF